MPTQGDQIQYNGSTSGYPSLTTNATNATPVNFPGGPWPAAAYLVVYLTGAWLYNPNPYWTVSSASGNPRLIISDSASNSCSCGAFSGTSTSLVNQALAIAAAQAQPNATYWVQSGSGPIGVYTQDNPYTDNVNGSPSPTYVLIPYPPQNVIATDATVNTPCGNILTGITLSWTAIPSATSFKIYRALVSGGPYSFIGSSATNSFTDDNLSASTEYYYVVTCVINGFESFFSAEVNTGSGLYSTVSPTVLSSAPSWFNAGANYPAGIYRICYVRGSYEYDPRGYAAGRGSTINGVTGIINPTPLGKIAGFYTTDGNGNETLAPGNTTLYPNESACEAGNAGLSILYSHVGGKIGVKLNDDPYWDNADDATGPTFTINPVPGCAINFTVSPSIGIQASSRTLTWSVSGSPASVSISNIGSVSASGSTIVNPTVPTTYTLTAVTATPPAITTTASVTASVGLPSPLQYLQASGNCGGDVLLSWGSSEFSNNYKVERSVTLAESWTTLTTQAGTSYEDTSAVANTVYDYRVTPTDGLNFGVSEVVVGIVNSVTPSVPSGLLAVAMNQRVQVSADPVQGASSYNLWRGFAIGQETLYVSGLTAPIYTDIDLQNGVPVFYTMTAQNPCGTSAQSSEVTATPLASLQSFAQLNPPATYWG